MTGLSRLTWNTLAAALLFISAASVFAQESATPEATTPIPAGSIYHASDVEMMRTLATQVGWKEGTVDEAADENADRFDQAWIAAVKDAVFGEAERLQNALQAIDQILQSNSVDKPQPKQVERLIESFDLVQATTEWKALSQEDREAFTARMEGYLKEVFNLANAIIFRSDSIPREHRNMASWKALQAYWGAITKNAEWIEKGCKSSEMNDGWLNRLQNDITSEGFFGHSPGEHVTTASISLAAGTALRSASPDAYIQLKPYLQSMLNAATELTQPNGEWPAFMTKERPSAMLNAELFERGYRLFGDQRSALLLDRIYENTPRSVPQAVIGGSTLLKAIGAELSSNLLPQTGAAWLRVKDSPLSVMLDTGVSRFGKQAGLLSMSVFQNNQPWAAYDGQNFNGVMIDNLAQPQYDFAPIGDFPAANALVMNMRETEEGAYVSATATGQFTERAAYGEEQVAGFRNGVYQRSLYLTDNLIIDLFCASAGSQQDYIYQTNGEWQTDAASTSFVAKSSDATERLWSVNPEGLQFSAGADDDQGLFKAHYVGQGNLFAFVHEFQQDQSQPTAIQLLPLDPAPNTRNFQAIAFAVERGERTDLFFASLSREIEYKGKYKDMPFTFKGDFGHIHFESVNMDSLFLIGGSTLEYDQYGVALNNAMQYGGLNQIASEDAMARTIMDESIPVHGLYSILALDMNAPSIKYQPFWVKAAGYEYEPNQPQRLLLIEPELTANNANGLGLKLHPGCKTLFHHTVYMKRFIHANRINHPAFGGKATPGYQLVTSAPVRVRIPVWNNLKKIVFSESSIIDRRRGDDLNGVIEFGVLPTETNDGRASFAYSP